MALSSSCENLDLFRLQFEERIQQTLHAITDYSSQSDEIMAVSLSILQSNPKISSEDKLWALHLAARISASVNQVNIQSFTQEFRVQMIAELKFIIVQENPSSPLAYLEIVLDRAKKYAKEGLFEKVEVLLQHVLPAVESEATELVLTAYDECVALYTEKASLSEEVLFDFKIAWGAYVQKHLPPSEKAMKRLCGLSAECARSRTLPLDGKHYLSINVLLFKLAFDYREEALLTHRQNPSEDNRQEMIKSTSIVINIVKQLKTQSSFLGFHPIWNEAIVKFGAVSTIIEYLKQNIQCLFTTMQNNDTFFKGLIDLLIPISKKFDSFDFCRVVVAIITEFNGFAVDEMTKLNQYLSQEQEVSKEPPPYDPTTFRFNSIGLPAFCCMASSPNSLWSFQDVQKYSPWIHSMIEYVFNNITHILKYEVAFETFRSKADCNQLEIYFRWMQAALRRSDWAEVNNLFHRCLELLNTFQQPVTYLSQITYFIKFFEDNPSPSFLRLLEGLQRLDPIRCSLITYFQSNNLQDIETFIETKGSLQYLLDHEAEYSNSPAIDAFLYRAACMALDFDKALNIIAKLQDVGLNSQLSKALKACKKNANEDLRKDSLNHIEQLLEFGLSFPQYVNAHKLMGLEEIDIKKRLLIYKTIKQWLAFCPNIQADILIQLLKLCHQAPFFIDEDSQKLNDIKRFLKACELERTKCNCTLSDMLKKPYFQALKMRLFSIEDQEAKLSLSVNVRQFLLSYLFGIDSCLNLETAVRDAKLAQDLELESLCSGAGHSQRVLDRPTANDSGSRDCVKLASPTAVFRLKPPQGVYPYIPADELLKIERIHVLQEMEEKPCANFEISKEVLVFLLNDGLVLQHFINTTINSKKPVLKYKREILITKLNTIVNSTSHEQIIYMLAIFLDAEPWKILQTHLPRLQQCATYLQKNGFTATLRSIEILNSPETMVILPGSLMECILSDDPLDENTFWHYSQNKMSMKDRINKQTEISVKQFETITKTYNNLTAEQKNHLRVLSEWEDKAGKVGFVSEWTKHNDIIFQHYDILSRNYYNLDNLYKQCDFYLQGDVSKELLQELMMMHKEAEALVMEFAKAENALIAEMRKQREDLIDRAKEYHKRYANLERKHLSGTKAAAHAAAVQKNQTLRNAKAEEIKAMEQEAARILEIRKAAFKERQAERVGPRAKILHQEPKDVLNTPQERLHAYLLAAKVHKDLGLENPYFRCAMAYHLWSVLNKLKAEHKVCRILRNHLIHNLEKLQSIKEIVVIARYLDAEDFKGLEEKAREWGLDRPNPTAEALFKRACHLMDLYDSKDFEQEIGVLACPLQLLPEELSSAASSYLVGEIGALVTALKISANLKDPLARKYLNKLKTYQPGIKNVQLEATDEPRNPYMDGDNFVGSSQAAAHRHVSELPDFREE